MTSNFMRSINFDEINLMKFYEMNFDEIQYYDKIHFDEIHFNKIKILFKSNFFYQSTHFWAWQGSAPACSHFYQVDNYQ